MRRLSALSLSLVVAYALGVAGCADEETTPAQVINAAIDSKPPADGGDTAPVTPDTGAPDVSSPDTLAPDTGAPDTQPPDAGAPDTAPSDAAAPDATTDTASPDMAKLDSAPDTAMPDTAPIDMATPDTAPDMAKLDSAPDMAMPDSAPVDTATPDVTPDTQATDAAACNIQCKKLFDVAALCQPMGSCKFNANATTAEGCFANGVNFLGTIMLSGDFSSYTTSFRVNRPDGATHCFTLVASGLVAGGDINYVWKDPAGNQLATGVGKSSGLTLVCDEGTYVNADKQCPGTNIPNASTCASATCP